MVLQKVTNKMKKNKRRNDYIPVTIAWKSSIRESLQWFSSEWRTRRKKNKLAQSHTYSHIYKWFQNEMLFLTLGYKSTRNTSKNRQKQTSKWRLQKKNDKKAKKCFEYFVFESWRWSVRTDMWACSCVWCCFKLQM